ncbi:Lrp/AsnC family transcriptional regulator [Methyloligella sp. 2.7D]|uniref:Lrp/AsnC family transcriptional regulator n=1 Tax=unclassified Methyloligella TaxID=2625955 RepID=UPI00157D3D31|nr:Lrp/AsnC family transcriptional regulator [Methyloligella sp. GL2]QKP76215.1 Lrp/AsnC family transcriptional regulator [Methyloligella sp. GL2]
MSNDANLPAETEAERSALSARSSPYDALNQKIVQLLQVDGRMSFREIAERLDVSEGTVRNRVTWMKEAGVMTIAAVVDPTVVQYKADAMLGIKVAPGATPAEVAERLGRHSEVVYVLWVSGRYDLLVELVLSAEEQLTPFLTEHCYARPDIASVEVMTGLKMYKNQFLLKRFFDAP